MMWGSVLHYVQIFLCRYIFLAPDSKGSDLIGIRFKYVQLFLFFSLSHCGLSLSCMCVLQRIVLLPDLHPGLLQCDVCSCDGSASCSGLCHLHHGHVPETGLGCVHEGTGRMGLW